MNTQTETVKCAHCGRTVDGWVWTEPNGTEHSEMGEWDELPPWPDSARTALAKAMKGG